jgi:hypothetical protein
MDLTGHSGSDLHLQDGWVRKSSAYFERCSEDDFHSRAVFLIELQAKFSYMPVIKFLEDREMAIEFIPGQEGLEGLDFPKFGQAVRKLHDLEIKGPLKDTGIDWLLELATENLNQVGGKLYIPIISVFKEFSAKAVVHGEITQVITRPDGEIYILDWDECGMGSPYQDLGFVYYQCLISELGKQHFQDFLLNYADETVDIHLVKMTAGLIALAYARFFDFEKRLTLGCKLLDINLVSF